MKAVILLDAGFLKRKFKQEFKTPLKAEYLPYIVNTLIQNVLHKNSSEISYRAYFYDCPPIDVKVVKPLSNNQILDFEKEKSFGTLTKFLSDVKQLPFFAVREGVLSFEGWKLNPKIYKTDCDSIQITMNDFTPDLKQKGVDTKIGLDIAWVSYEKIAENIILVTGDSDFTPAIKTARRNGIFVHLFTLGHGVKQNLKDCVDVLHSETLKTIGFSLN